MNSLLLRSKNKQLCSFAVVSLFSLLQCTSKEPEFHYGSCDCQRKSEVEENKNIEAVLVFIPGNQPDGYQGPDLYILSTDPKDFESTTFSIGKNVLVPCNSIPEQYRKAGSRLIASYKRKNCYGAMTLPQLRSDFGYFIELTSIRSKP